MESSQEDKTCILISEKKAAVENIGAPSALCCAYNVPSAFKQKPQEGTAENKASSKVASRY